MGLRDLLAGEQKGAVVVAMDHGVFGEGSIIQGIENLGEVVSRVAAAEPDAIQLSLGAAERLASGVDWGSVDLVVRLDMTNAYAAAAGDDLFSLRVADGIERAQALGASAAVVNLLRSSSSVSLYRDCLEIVNQTVAEAKRQGLPLIVEPLVLEDSGPIRYSSVTNLEAILPLVRQAAELGADAIKADPTSEASEYDKVVEAAAVPLLVRGGGRIDDEELLRRTSEVMDAGASGIVYGRNIFQRPDPGEIVRRLTDLVRS